MASASAFYTAVSGIPWLRLEDCLGSCLAFSSWPPTWPPSWPPCQRGLARRSRDWGIPRGLDPGDLSPEDWGIPRGLARRSRDRGIPMDPAGCAANVWGIYEAELPESLRLLPVNRQNPPPFDKGGKGHGDRCCFLSVFGKDHGGRCCLLSVFGKGNEGRCCLLSVFGKGHEVH